MAELDARMRRIFIASINDINAGLELIEAIEEGGTGQVRSVFGRQGDVTAQDGDYTVDQITGAMATTGSASGMTVLAAGSTTSRTLADRAAAVFDVRDYGAVGDGLTDDLAAIQSAINAAHTAGGGTVLFSRGTYVVQPHLYDKTITLYSNLWLKGEGQAILKIANTTGNYYALFRGPEGSPQLTNIRVSGLHFDQNPSRPGPGGLWSVTTKTMVASGVNPAVATLTLGSVHSFVVDDSITVSGVDSTFNGTWRLSAVTSHSVSYSLYASLTISAISPTPCSGTITGTYDIGAAGTLTYPGLPNAGNVVDSWEIVFYLTAIDGFIVHDCVFDPCPAVNGIIILYAGSLHILIESNIFHFVRGRSTSNPYYDVSTIYVEAASYTITNNLFTAAVSDHAYTALELHNGMAVVEGNVIDGYVTAMLVVTGAVADPPNTGPWISGNEALNCFTVQGNRISRASNGILMVSYADLTLNNVVIDGNTISLNQGDIGSTASIGIATSLDVGSYENVVISNNVITFQATDTNRSTGWNPGLPLGPSSLYPAWPTSYPLDPISHCGIGFLGQYVGSNPAFIKDVVVSNNTIRNAPGVGIFFGLPDVETYGGMPVTGVRIHGNVLYDAGINAGLPASAGGLTYRSAIVLGGVIDSLVCQDNLIYDSGPGALKGVNALIYRPTSAINVRWTGNVLHAKSGIPLAVVNNSQPLALIDYVSTNPTTANVSVGTSALGSVTSGVSNVAVGVNALVYCTTGGYNVAVGAASLQSLTTGSNNMAIGRWALLSITTASNNLAIGDSALSYLAGAASYNTAIGANALGGSTACNNNVAIGVNSGSSDSSGSGNTYIGNATSAASSSLTISTAIGYGAQITASHQIMLGTSAETVAHPGGVIFHRTAVSNSYSILPTDYMLGVSSTAANYTLTLPTASSVTGQTYVIKDESGGASTHNITLATTSSQTIDGSSTKVINTNYGTLNVYSNGTHWFTF